MQTIALQRKWDLTLGEVERFRELKGGRIGAQMGKYVRTHSRLLVPRRYVHEHTGEIEYTHNLVTNEGLDHVLDVELNALAALAVWYFTGFSDNITVLASHDYAAPGTTEITTSDVEEAVRETMNFNAASSQSIDNVGTVAQYKADQTFTFYGGQIMAGSSAFGDATDDAVHIYWAGKLFGTAKSMILDDTVDLTYTFTSSAV